jgi:hypothetical protein
MALAKRPVEVPGLHAQGTPESHQRARIAACPPWSDEATLRYRTEPHSLRQTHPNA